MLAEIGALNAFGYTRREALWQVERAIRPTGELYAEGTVSRDLANVRSCELTSHDSNFARSQDEDCPLPKMSAAERVIADYEGTGLTIGPHPMALRREEMSLRGALRASDLARARDGRRVRVLYPPALRDEVATRHREAAAQYR